MAAVQAQNLLFLTTAVLNSSPRWRCCLPTSFLAIFTIEESFFFLFSFLLHLQVSIPSNCSHLIANSTRLDKKLPVSNSRNVRATLTFCFCFSHLSSSGVIMLTKWPPVQSVCLVTLSLQCPVWPEEVAQFWGPIITCCTRHDGWSSSKNTSKWMAGNTEVLTDTDPLI